MRMKHMHQIWEPTLPARLSRCRGPARALLEADEAAARSSAFHSCLAAVPDVMTYYDYSGLFEGCPDAKDSVA